MPNWLLFASPVVGALIALIIGVSGPWIGRRLGLMDYPDHGGRKRHKRITPLIGGLAIMVVFAVATGTTLLAVDIGVPAARHLGWMLAATLLLGGIGMIDDRLQLTASLRLALAIGGLAIMVLAAPEFALDFLRFTGQSDVILLAGWGGLFTLLCLVGLLNAVNMADGKDGLVISLSTFWALLLLLRAPEALQPGLLGVIAALIVLLGFNMAGRLFLGDSGSYALSALLGLAAIYVYNHDFAAWRADGVALIFAVPVIDTIRLMGLRIIRGTSPFAPDRNHLHHHLAYGWGWPRGLIVYFLMVAVPNLAALRWPEATSSLLGATVLGYVALLHLSDRRRPVDEQARDFR